MKVPPEVLKRIKRDKYIRLDLACGAAKQGPEWIGMDYQKLPGVDIVHDIEEYPWPLPDGCCEIIVGSHIAEHINPAKGGFIKWMNEAWRVMKPDGQFMLALPYGLSYGYVQDPTHCNPCNETTWTYFDPLAPTGFYRFYAPDPWETLKCVWDVEGFMEVVLRKRRKDPSYYLR